MSTFFGTLCLFILLSMLITIKTNPTRNPSKSDERTLNSVNYPSPNNNNNNNNNNNFQPNRGYYNPYPTMAWLPFDPVSAPDNSEPCKRWCKRACGWTYIGGDSYCCEYSASGSCDIATIHGSCYCGT